MGAIAQTEGGTFQDILAICRRINSERDLGALLDLIAREATKLLDCDRASIFLLDRERHELWSKVALGSEEILRFAAEHIGGTQDEWSLRADAAVRVCVADRRCVSVCGRQR